MVSSMGIFRLDALMGCVMGACFFPPALRSALSLLLLPVENSSLRYSSSASRCAALLLRAVRLYRFRGLPARPRVSVGRAVRSGQFQGSIRKFNNGGREMTRPAWSDRAFSALFARRLFLWRFFHRRPHRPLSGFLSFGRGRFFRRGVSSGAMDSAVVSTPRIRRGGRGALPLRAALRHGRFRFWFRPRAQ